ncbi:MFS transporter [Castellaniella caeni]|uniref:MFS transporter n=1 Tax=Castellaniella caeni TaxID=266123 RepID=UPI000A0782DE|nr:MFS transporter [Castellaniella caeni]
MKVPVLSSAPEAGQPAPPVDPRTRLRVLVILTIWFCMALVDVGIVNVALPSIQEDLGASAADLQWILSGYALTFGTVLIAAGRAGDILGHGAVFLAGLVVFTGASLAAALAVSPAWLNLMRFLAGIGAGGMSPQVYGMVQRYFSGAARGRAFGTLGMVASLSVALAPPLGGALIMLGGPSWGWRLTFLINVPIGLVGLVLGWCWFPRPLLVRGQKTAVLAALDGVGGLLAALAVFSLLFPFVRFHEATGLAVWSWLLVSGVATWAWVVWERRQKRLRRPMMVDVAVFAEAGFRNGLAIQLLYFLGMTSVWVLVMLYAQQQAHLSALAAGLLSVPSAVAAACAARWAGQRVHRLGRRLVVLGQALALAGVLLAMGALAANALAGASLWWVAAALTVYGAGQGAIISPNQTLTLERVPSAYAGSAGALVSATQRVGAAVGIAIVTGTSFAVLARSTWGWAALAGLLVIVCMMLVALGVSWLDLRGARARVPLPG